MTLSFWLRSFCLSLVLVFPCFCFAQHGESLDVEKCFPSILQDSRVNIEKTQLRYALMSVWNRDLYESAKQRAVMETLVPEYGYSKNDFENTNEKILKEFYSKNENLEYTRDTASATFFLDPQAGGIIENCLAAMSRRGYGLSSAYYLDGPYKATLELFWSWVPSESPLQIKTKTISNARVTDDHGKHPNLLFPPSKKGSDWGNLDQPSDVITLERLKADEPIVINIVTNPNVGARHIVIPPVSKKQHCDPIVKTEDQFKTPFSQTFDFHLEQQPRTSDDGHGHKYFSYRVEIEKLENGKEGLVRDATCVKISGPGVPGDFAEITAVPKDLKSATCEGWWQEVGRMARLTVSWYKTGYACKPEDWPPPASVATEWPTPNPIPSNGKTYFNKVKATKETK